MSVRQQYAPAPVHSLLNHLDATLAACAELVNLQGGAADPHRLLRLELIAIAHVLQARHDMQECAFEDCALASQVRLFLAITDCLEGATVPPLRLEAEAKNLIAGRIPAATLTALAAAMRDVLAVCYHLNGGDAVPEPQRMRPAIPDALVWATALDAV